MMHGQTQIKFTLIYLSSLGMCLWVPTW